MRFVTPPASRATPTESNNRTDPLTGLPILGNVAETFEFRAISRDLETPWIEQFGIGIQRQLGTNLMVEARYVGSRGHELLESRAFNQGFDLNDPSTPDYIFERFNRAYVDASARTARSTPARRRASAVLARRSDSPIR